MTTSLPYGDQLEFESQASDHIRRRPIKVADADIIRAQRGLDPRSGVAQRLSRRLLTARFQVRILVPEPIMTLLTRGSLGRALVPPRTCDHSLQPGRPSSP